MTANELFRSGKLKEAIQASTDEVRQNPLDTTRRSFLFELLCFAGEFDRAGKQLDVLGQGGQQAELGALLLRAAIHSERERQDFFTKKAYLDMAGPASEPPAAGTINGQAFREISDADPRIGARFEVFLAGKYIWVPFAHITSIQMQPPKRLRDLLWAAVLIRNGPNFKGRDLGEVMTPVLSPFTYTRADDNVRLGRATVWEEVDGAEIPFGQRMLLVDGEEMPLLELRSLEFASADAEQSAAVS
ncbi:MAG: type VI secretion system accessory protein TagJ [Terriglobales bacterium]